MTKMTILILIIIIQSSASFLGHVKSVLRVFFLKKYIYKACTPLKAKYSVRFLVAIMFC